MVPALDSSVLNRLIDPGPISRPIKPLGTAPTSTVWGGESAANFSVTTRSTGSRNTS
ncbi:Uncharacterised protein [Mycobacterium tuberculosis]|uniref:Uncharacterized protein n=1 Tax=Mycobacterium tuberculosis TaxID=1773 RepID=A0A654TXS6_MYCTX|nr:Uncharacterised protein [Mycobacterium tuberculosis]CLA11937.1 Uncharacterised protein [Mycobacterium tuberculosis]CNW00593.1 Uncharacterised protein [Mycobacterium tuberculosis]